MGASNETTDSVFPARIHVIVARTAPYAVVIRRGPSKHVCTIGWNLKTDEFQFGQWLKGRIYERRCDLSPDGRHFIYFAMNGKWNSETRGSWTAISRAPYLKAIGLWGKGDCWNGGGLFLTNRNYWINTGYGHTKMRTPQGLTQVSSHPTAPYQSGECPGVYYPRLLRDGWVPATKDLPDQTDGSQTDVTAFDKKINGQWVLRKFAFATTNHPIGKGCYFDEHVLRGTGGKEIEVRDWEWADAAHGRLLWSREGSIYAGRLRDDGITKETMLKDFNEMKFASIAAPY